MKVTNENNNGIFYNVLNFFDRSLSYLDPLFKKAVDLVAPVFINTAAVFAPSRKIELQPSNQQSKKVTEVFSERKERDSKITSETNSKTTTTTATQTEEFKESEPQRIETVGKQFDRMVKEWEEFEENMTPEKQKLIDDHVMKVMNTQKFKEHMTGVVKKGEAQIDKVIGMLEANIEKVFAEQQKPLEEAMEKEVQHRVQQQLGRLVRYPYR